jgi:acyl carrier protein
MITTFERLKTVLLKTYPVDPATVTYDRPLDELGLDSLGIGLLLFDVEDEFKIKFVSDPGPLRTVRDVVNYIDGMLATRPSDAPSSAAHPLPGS